MFPVGGSMGAVCSFFWRGMVFWKGAAFRVRLAHVRWGAVDRRSSAKEEGSALPVRVGGVSMLVVSESSRACRDSTTARGVRALGERVRGCDLSY